jgi:hypothetical protein
VAAAPPRDRLGGAEEARDDAVRRCHHRRAPRPVALAPGGPGGDAGGAPRAMGARGAPPASRRRAAQSAGSGGPTSKDDSGLRVRRGGLRRLARAGSRDSTASGSCPWTSAARTSDLHRCTPGHLRGSGPTARTHDAFGEHGVLGDGAMPGGWRAARPGRCSNSRWSEDPLYPSWRSRLAPLLAPRSDRSALRG